MQYQYTAVSNADMFEWGYRCDFIIILDNCDLLVSNISHFGNDISCFNGLSWH